MRLNQYKIRAMSPAPRLTPTDSTDRQLPSSVAVVQGALSGRRLRLAAGGAVRSVAGAASRRREAGLRAIVAGLAETTPRPAGCPALSAQMTLTAGRRISDLSRNTFSSVSKHVPVGGSDRRAIVDLSEPVPAVTMFVCSTLMCCTEYCLV